VISLAVAMDNDTGEVTVHTADCPVVRKMAENGHPVMTLIDCEKMPDVTEYKRHECLTANSEKSSANT